MRTRSFVNRAVTRLALEMGYYATTLQPGERHFLRNLSDDSVPLPPGADEALRPDAPRLQELRRRYAELDWPSRTPSTWWSEGTVSAAVSLRYFRGDNPFIWHYRELPRITELKYLLYVQYLRSRGAGPLLDRLHEDGAFGCWTYEFPDTPRVSRDLLDSANELAFLDRHLGLLGQDGFRCLDIGAGYGRLAHRAAEAIPGLADYACADAIPESTFLCEYYTAFRGVAPPVRVVELPAVPELTTGSFDLAVNVHSFSECTAAAVRWWVDELRRLEVPWLFVVPNEPVGFLTREADDGRLDYGSIFEEAGYRLVAEERVVGDAAVRSRLGIEDRHCLFRYDP